MGSRWQLRISAKMGQRVSKGPGWGRKLKQVHISKKPLLFRQQQRCAIERNNWAQLAQVVTHADHAHWAGKAIRELHADIFVRCKHPRSHPMRRVGTIVLAIVWRAGQPCHKLLTPC